MTTQLPTPIQRLGPSVHDGLSITGFVLAIFLPLIGFILSWVAIASAHRDGRKASGLAVAGVIIGGLETVIIIVVIIAVAASQPDQAQQFANCIQGQINGTVSQSVDCAQLYGAG